MAAWTRSGSLDQEVGPWASLQWLVLSPRLFSVCFEKLSELNLGMNLSQEKINEELGEKKKERHTEDGPKSCPPRESGS